MMIKILFYYLLGYVRVVVEGYYIERFINICANKKITIWNLKREKNVKLYLNVGISDFKKIIPIAKKTQCHVHIEKKKGFPFFLHRYKKRKIFFGLLLILIILIGISSNFIWNVEITEESGVILEGIRQDIEEAGLKSGKLKKDINTKEIINQVRLKRQDVAWMGIELKGTNAIIKLVKADEKPEIIDENDYCNIVSDKVGVITKINAQNGTAAVKVGDTVNKGTVLIQGWLEGKYTGIRYVHARGQIEAKVWYTKSTKILYHTTETIETGNVEKNYAIKFNNFKINFPKRVSKFKIYDTIDEERKFKISSDFYLPISFVTTTNRELKEEEKNRTIEEAKQLGVQQLEQLLLQEIEQKNNIVNENINTYEKEDGLEVFVTYEVLESIGTNEKIVF